MDPAACPPPASRRLVEDFTVHIEKSPAEVERTLDGGLRSEVKGDIGIFRQKEGRGAAHR